MLTGRSAIITGASQGMGRAIAEDFVQAGASVFLVARNEEQLRSVEADLAARLRLPGQVVAAHAADVSNPNHCKAVVNRAHAVLPNLTALVNNAGIYGPMGRIEENDWEEWVAAMQVTALALYANPAWTKLAASWIAAA